MGWMFTGLPANPLQHAPDVMRNPALKRYSGQYHYWLLGGWLAPGLILYAWQHTGYAFLEGVLWGGSVRTLVVQQSTWCVNSLCHLFGRAPHAVRDRSRNVPWLAYLTFGESWHNNHHAFPLAAFHGHSWRQVDPAGWIIRALALAGWAWDVKRPVPAAPDKEKVHAT
jgi:stearoyl-CoA desaturase (delta-9 desaturase)